VGEAFDATCKDCGTVSHVSLGGGFTFVMLHCETCGKPKTISLREPIDPDDDAYGVCECGGGLSHDALPRCSNCRSVDLEPIEGTHVLYD
jgi:hypothetical protein